MSTLRNSVRLVGNLGMDPEIKRLESDKKLARISLATSDSYHNDKGEKITETQWHNLVLWGKQADIAESYLKKGDEVTVQGKLTSRSYTDKEGNKKYVSEVVVSEVLLMGGKKG